MEGEGSNKRLIQQLADGFEALQDEYHKLHVQHQALERKLATAREQYNQVVRLYGSSATTTPPLSLTSSPGKRYQADGVQRTVSDLLATSTDEASQSAAAKVGLADQALPQLRNAYLETRDPLSSGVKIWSGRSADRQDLSSSQMPSISESPLEQDFTIEGMPSRLGCPFASMAKKKLSSHAASVLSRYNNSAAGTPTSPSLVSANRINGKESLEARRNSGKKESIVDPIKAEICGLSDHDDEHANAAVEHDAAHLSAAESAEEKHQPPASVAAEVGVCPIRFLDQHSPEEVATYFERHKHELPRSHESCVKRYQSNEQQIRELDAKYGNIVSMISGLGAKHKDMLPEEPDEDGVEEPDAVELAKIRKWASSVSAMGDAAAPEEVGEADEERRPHFERPLRDIRVGESPSRPWGITVPAKYVETAQNEASEASSHPVEINPQPKAPTKDASKPLKCPFGHSKPAAKPAQPHETPAQPVFISPQAAQVDTPTKADPARPEAVGQQRGMVFTGPVFVGYSADDAAKIMRDGFGNR